MMKTKEEMMKEAIKMGLTAGAVGCIAVLSAEELEMLATNPEPPEDVTKTDLEANKKVVAQVYVDQIEELIGKLEALGYDVMFNTRETFIDIEVDHDNKLVEMFGD